MVSSDGGGPVQGRDPTAKMLLEKPTLKVMSGERRNAGGSVRRRTQDPKPRGLLMNLVSLTQLLFHGTVLFRNPLVLYCEQAFQFRWLAYCKLTLVAVILTL